MTLLILPLGIVMWIIAIILCKVCDERVVPPAWLMFITMAVTITGFLFTVTGIMSILAR